MENIKSYTDLDQSKKLAEILPLESADGFWEFHTEWGSDGDKWEGYEDYPNATPYLEYTRQENEWREEKQDMPCWSLTALLRVIPYVSLEEYNGIWSCTSYNKEKGKHVFGNLADNPIDACVDMVKKLYELKML